MGTHPIFESDFDCLTDSHQRKKMKKRTMKNEEGKTVWIKSGKPVGREKDPNTVHQPYVPTGRPRGRPKKDPSQLKSVTKKPMKESTDGAKPGRGRPPKANKEATTKPKQDASE